MHVSLPLMCKGLLSLKTPATRCLTDGTCLQSNYIYAALHWVTQFYVNKLSFMSALRRHHMVSLWFPSQYLTRSNAATINFTTSKTSYNK